MRRLTGYGYLFAGRNRVNSIDSMGKKGRGHEIMRAADVDSQRKIGQKVCIQFPYFGRQS